MVALKIRTAGSKGTGVIKINLEDYLDTSNYLMLIQYLNTDSTVEKEERYFKKHFFK